MELTFKRLDLPLAGQLESIGYILDMCKLYANISILKDKLIVQFQEKEDMDYFLKVWSEQFGE